MPELRGSLQRDLFSTVWRQWEHTRLKTADRTTESAIGGGGGRGRDTHTHTHTHIHGWGLEVYCLASSCVSEEPRWSVSSFDWIILHNE